MRISNQQAETLALELAEAHLRSKDPKGFAWRCYSASPDLQSPQNMDRKIYTKWSVLVEYSKGGAVVDGPAVILVDIVAGQCRFGGEGAA